MQKQKKWYAKYCARVIYLKIDIKENYRDAKTKLLD